MKAGTFGGSRNYIVHSGFSESMASWSTMQVRQRNGNTMLGGLPKRILACIQLGNTTDILSEATCPIVRWASTVKPCDSCWHVWWQRKLHRPTVPMEAKQVGILTLQFGDSFQGITVVGFILARSRRH